MDKERIIQTIIEMDAKVCLILDDEHGESEAVKLIREYEKKLFELLEVKL